MTLCKKFWLCCTMKEKFQVHQIFEEYTKWLPILLDISNYSVKEIPKLRLRVVLQRFTAVRKGTQNRERFACTLQVSTTEYFLKSDFILQWKHGLSWKDLERPHKENQMSRMTKFNFLTQWKKTLCYIHRLSSFWDSLSCHRFLFCLYRHGFIYELASIIHKVTEYKVK